MDLTLLLLLLIGGQTAWSISIEISMNKDKLMPGDLFRFRCRTESTDTNDVIQIIKTQVNYFSEKDHISTQPEIGVYHICNGTEINPLLMAETTRYRATEEVRDNLVVTIADVQPEDSGYWACRVVRDGRVAIQSQDKQLHIIGPVETVHFIPEDGSLPYPSDSNIHINNDEFTASTLTCEVNVTNTRPDIKLLVRQQFGIKIPAKIHLQHTHITTKDGGLVFFNNQYLVTPSDRDSLWNYNGWDLQCQVSLEGYSTITDTVQLNVTYSPRVMKCDSPVRAPLNTTHVVLKCSVEGNPPPNGNWIHPSGKSLVGDQQIVGDRVLMTLTLTDTIRKDYGEYKITAENAYGSSDATIMLVQEIGGGSCKCCSLSAIQLLIVIYAGIFLVSSA